MDHALLNTLSSGANEIGIHLGKEELNLFSIYHRELLLWNRRINLISEKSAREIVVRHFVDSLTPAPWIAPPEGCLIDLGSGGGFPGLPLRIAFPGLKLTLVEASRKKTSFLSHIVRMLALDNVTVIRERAEVLIGEKACAGRFDMVISRAAFKLPELVRMASFLLVPGGRLLAMKGLAAQEEMAAAEPSLAAAGMVAEGCRDVHLPIIKLQSKIISYKRVPGNLFH